MIRKLVTRQYNSSIFAGGSEKDLFICQVLDGHGGRRSGGGEEMVGNGQEIGHQAI